MDDYYIDIPDCSFLSGYPPEELYRNYVSYDVMESIPESDRTTFLWIISLATEMENTEIWKEIPGYRHAAFGYLHPSLEVNGFGVVIYANPLPYFEDQVRYVKINHWEFPVFIRRSIRIRHSLPNIHPSGGTAGCWAESKKPGLYVSNGFLTAKHVFPQGTKAGDKVQLTNGYGEVIDIGPDGIDAALVALDDPSLYNPGKNISTQMFPIPWTLASFNGQITGSVHARITSVSDFRGVIHNPSIPLRVFLSKSGNPGDSGSTVFGPMGEGIGIYVGELMDPRGVIEGYSQHIGQVAGIMNLALYE